MSVNNQLSWADCLNLFELRSYEHLCTVLRDREESMFCLKIVSSSMPSEKNWMEIWVVMTFCSKNLELRVWLFGLWRVQTVFKVNQKCSNVRTDPLARMGLLSGVSGWQMLQSQIDIFLWPHELHVLYWWRLLRGFLQPGQYSMWPKYIWWWGWVLPITIII